eukprot:6460481-Amphidinium_carterae.2
MRLSATSRSLSVLRTFVAGSWTALVSASAMATLWKRLCPKLLQPEWPQRDSKCTGVQESTIMIHHAWKSISADIARQLYARLTLVQLSPNISSCQRCIPEDLKCTASAWISMS